MLRDRSKKIDSIRSRREKRNIVVLKKISDEDIEKIIDEIPETRSFDPYSSKIITKINKDKIRPHFYDIYMADNDNSFNILKNAVITLWNNAIYQSGHNIGSDTSSSVSSVSMQTSFNTKHAAGNSQGNNLEDSLEWFRGLIYTTKGDKEKKETFNILHFNFPATFDDVIEMRGMFTQNILKNFITSHEVFINLYDVPVKYQKKYLELMTRKFHIRLELNLDNVNNVVIVDEINSRNGFIHAVPEDEENILIYSLDPEDTKKVLENIVLEDFIDPKYLMIKKHIIIKRKPNQNIIPVYKPEWWNKKYESYYVFRVYLDKNEMYKFRLTPEIISKKIISENICAHIQPSPFLYGYLDFFVKKQDVNDKEGEIYLFQSNIIHKVSELKIKGIKGIKNVIPITKRKNIIFDNPNKLRISIFKKWIGDKAWKEKWSRYENLENKLWFLPINQVKLKTEVPISYDEIERMIEKSGLEIISDFDGSKKVTINNIFVKGYYVFNKDIVDSNPLKIISNYLDEVFKYKGKRTPETHYVYATTVGDNYEEMMKIPWIDTEKSYTTDIHDMYDIYGVEIGRSHMIIIIYIFILYKMNMMDVNLTNISILMDIIYSKGSPVGLKRFSEHLHGISSITTQKQHPGFINYSLQREKESTKTSPAATFSGQIRKMSHEYDDPEIFKEEKIRLEKEMAYEKRKREYPMKMDELRRENYLGWVQMILNNTKENTRKYLSFEERKENNYSKDELRQLEDDKIFHILSEVEYEAGEKPSIGDVIDPPPRINALINKSSDVQTERSSMKLTEIIRTDSDIRKEKERNKSLFERVYPYEIGYLNIPDSVKKSIVKLGDTIFIEEKSKTEDIEEKFPFLYKTKIRFNNNKFIEIAIDTYFDSVLEQKFDSSSFEIIKFDGRYNSISGIEDLERTEDITIKLKLSVKKLKDTLEKYGL